MSIFFRTLIVLYFICFTGSAQAAGTKVFDVRVGVQAAGLRVVIESEKPSGISVTDGDQGVVSIGSFRYLGKPPFVADGIGINKVVVEPDSGLVILSFARPMKLAQKLVLPSTAYPNSSRFVFDFMPIPGQGASARPSVVPANDRVLDPPQTLGQLRTVTKTTTVIERPVAVPPPSPPASIETATPASQPEKNLYKEEYKSESVVKRADGPLTIVIDAGHGGKDPGARSPSGILEKNITLAMAKALGIELRRRGHSVYLTRDTDNFIPLRGRVKIAQKYKADLFISIHADSMGNGSRTTRGASVYTLSDMASDKETAALAARENQVDVLMGVDLSHEDKDVANILIDLAMRDTMNQSKKLANALVAQFNHADLKMLSPPHRFAGFAVLKAADVPSILIELGFLSSPEESNALNTESYRARLARTIADTVDDYNERHRPQE